MKKIILFLAIALLAACGEGERTPAASDLPSELQVLTREGPTTYGSEEGVGAVGFEHDLAQLFAEDLGIPVRFIVAADEDDVRRRLRQNEAQFAAAWLTGGDGSLRASRSYTQTSSLLVMHEASLPIGEVSRLQGRTVDVRAGSPQAALLRGLREEVPQLTLREDTTASSLDLLEAVAHRRRDAALVDRAVYRIAVNFYPELVGDLEIGGEQPIAWLFAPRTSDKLIERANAFLERVAGDGTLTRLMDRYFGHIERLDQTDLALFRERTRSLLPKYRKFFHEAQALSGIDWRLLAALAYQESQWDPLATSPRGVRGMMMLTNETADHLQVENRLDARASILAGARYVAELRDELPQSIKEPDRVWLALAAYNVGMGHVRNARRLASQLRSDPDSWYDMKSVLPQLSRPSVAEKLRTKPARGGEAVILVENVRIFADILMRHEPAVNAGDMAPLGRGKPPGLRAPSAGR